MRNQYPKAYLRIDPNIDAHPDPGTIVLLMVWANRQGHRGRFKTLATVEKVIGRKRVAAAVERGDLVKGDEGYYLAGWDEWQEGDLDVASRMKRLRERKRNAVTPATVTPPSLTSEALGRLGVKASRDNGTTDASGGVADATVTLPFPVQDQSSGKADAIRRVFDHWRYAMGHPEAKLTNERRLRVEARLREGYTFDQLFEAIDGCKASAFHMGENERGAVYDDLGLICRNGSKVEQFRALRGARPAARASPARASVGDRTLAALERFDARRQGGTGPGAGEAVQPQLEPDRSGVPPGTRRPDP